LLAGKLLDYTSEKKLMTFGLLCSSVSFISIIGVFLSPVFAIISGAFLTIGNAFMLNIVAVVYANFFGRAHVGAISSSGDSLLVLGSAVGPVIFGLIRDVTGHYFGALVSAGVLPLVLIALLLRFGDPPPNAPESQMVGKDFEMQVVPLIEDGDEVEESNSVSNSQPVCTKEESVD